VWTRTGYGGSTSYRSDRTPVRGWHRETMVLRWSAVEVLESERSVREIVGYCAVAILVVALRAHDAKIDRDSTVEHAEKAA
jgi:hypothetical protein